MGVRPSQGTAGDAHDTAMAESVIGLEESKLIRQEGPWRSQDEVEYATLEWVTWFDTQRLLEPLGHLPPAQLEDQHQEQQTPAEVGGLD
jgi:transposase InsO family protein